MSLKLISSPGTDTVLRTSRVFFTKQLEADKPLGKRWVLKALVLELGQYQRTDKRLYKLINYWTGIPRVRNNQK